MTEFEQRQDSYIAMCQRALRLHTDAQKVQRQLAQLRELRHAMRQKAGGEEKAALDATIAAAEDEFAALEMERTTARAEAEMLHATIWAMARMAPIGGD